MQIQTRTSPTNVKLKKKKNSHIHFPQQNLTNEQKNSHILGPELHLFANSISSSDGLPLPDSGHLMNKASLSFCISNTFLYPKKQPPAQSIKCPLFFLKCA